MAIFKQLLMTIVGALFLHSCATSQIARPEFSIHELVKDSKATVFVWWATQCPCVARYESRIEALSRTFSPKGVHFYIIASNSDDNREKIDRVAQTRGFKLPIMMDAGAALATHFGVRSTPTIVIVDAKGNVKYRGWIDNERQVGDSGRIAYAENALQQIVENESVSQSSSPIYGCRITKSLR